ncbi:MAG: sensor histidine kinase, partial [Lachnospiraceae bacterium]|nr:sensor histidine kinase [Lachnospiraceae bacterium]
IDLMTDVIINLIDNGVKASNKGGRIILRSYGNCIEVQDFGRGIPKEEQEKILEPFYMVDKSRSRKSGGAGLGLALAALIAKRHNILLKIDSEQGQGTRMILQFV